MKFLTVTDSGMEEILWNSAKPVAEGVVKKYQRRTNQAMLSGAQCTAVLQFCSCFYMFNSSVLCASICPIWSNTWRI